MKLLKLVGVMISLLVFSVSMIQGVSASPLLSTSEGCAFVNFNLTGPQIHTVPKFFVDDDEIHVTTSVPSTIVLSQPDGSYSSQVYTDVTSASINIPSYSSDTYVLEVHRYSGTGNFHITSTCTPSPISDSCEIFNDYYDGGNSVTGPFNAGEQFRVMSSNVLINLNVSGAGSASYTNIPVGTFQYYTFPVTGTYTLAFSAVGGRRPEGLYQCTVPRHIILH